MNGEDSGSSSATKIVLIVVGVVGGIVVLIILACAGIAYFGMRAVQQVGASAMQLATDVQASQAAAEEFLADIAGGQVDLAYSQTTKDFQARQTLQEFRALIDKNPILKTRSSSFLGSQSITGTRAVFRATVSAPDGKTLNCTVTVVKEGDTWKVDRLTVP